MYSSCIDRTHCSSPAQQQKPQSDLHTEAALTMTINDSLGKKKASLLVSILQLTSTVTALAQHALSAVDLRQHTADHPRLGVIDHVSLHPLGPEATLQLAAAAANDIGQRLAAPPIGLPVYYYGSAHRDGRGLAEVRRRLGGCRAARLAWHDDVIITAMSVLSWGVIYCELCDAACSATGPCHDC